MIIRKCPFCRRELKNGSEQDNRLKKDYPGMSKADALQKGIEDQIKQNPDLFKHLNK